MRFTHTTRPAWIEGIVDPKGDHIKISYGQRQVPVALLSCAARNTFTVEFVVSRSITHRFANRIREAVCRELDFYLLHCVGPDSWAFVQYHCNTAANTCSTVHWSWQPKPEAA